MANPGFTLIAVVSLAIGVGANCAVFSWADALLLRPLPVPRPDEVLTIGSTASLESLGSSLVASYPEYVDVRDRSSAFGGLVAFTGATTGFARDADTTPKRKLGLLVSGNYFSVLGVQPDLGRTFRPEEDQVPGRDPVLILGHDLWEEQFGADRGVLGHKVRLNGIEFTVVGVAPGSFPGLNQFVRYDFYAPLMMWPRLGTDPNARPLEDRKNRSITIKGRLKPGATLARAQSELTVIAAALERAYPDTNRNRTMAIRSELQARIAQDQPDALLIAMLTTLAAAVLFVACANIAGLLTSRAPMRAREIALRLAIGAGRARVIRQLITESLLLAVLGGLLGLVIGYAGITVFRQIRIPTDLPVLLTFEMNRRAMLFSLGVALVSAILFGLGPAIHATRADLTSVMKASDAAGFGRRRRWGRALLVGGQVAVSVVVLVIATFMYRGFRRQVAAGPGYRTDHLLMMSFDPSLVRYTAPQAQHFFDQVVERARAIPGARSAALASSVPMSTDGQNVVTIVPEGFQFAAGKESVTLLGAMVDEHYFDTMGLSLIEGRRFRETDAADAPEVAIVNQRLAEHYWPGQDPVGKRFRMNDSAGPWVEVVGLAKDSKYVFLAEAPIEFVYLPYRQRPQASMILLVESSGDPATLVTPAREMVRSLDANLPIFNVRTMEEFYRMRTISIFNIIIGIVAAMGLMGLGLAIVGLYGLVAYAASRRTREIGIRMAIGADRPSVLRMVLRQGLLLAVGGLVVGMAASVGAGRVLAAMFPGGGGGRRGVDVAALALVGLVTLAVTLVAAYVPSRRASRVDPMSALREE